MAPISARFTRQSRPILRAERSQWSLAADRLPVGRRTLWKEIAGLFGP